MNDKQKKTLFRSAAAALIVASDYAGFLDSGNSFVIEAMVDEGLSRKEAVVFFTAMGEKETGASEAYLQCFVTLGIEPEYEAWTDTPGIMEAIKNEILGMIQNSLSVTGYLH